MKKHLRDYAFLFTLAGIVIAIDQITKSLVRTHLALQEIWAPWRWLVPYARIVHWKNSGAAFGMLQGLGDIFTILAILVAVAIIYYFPQVSRDDWVLRLAMGFQLGGAIGNLIDRITSGYVTDFISIGTLPVFNVADASITMGVTILILGMWVKEQNHTAAENETDPELTNHIQETSTAPIPEEIKGE